MKHDIVVIGGYGQVGQVLCRELGALYPGRVYAVGRSYSKAKRFSDATGGSVLPLQLDVNERLPADVFRDAALVVMCLDVRHTGVVQACIDHRVDYIDITADYSVMASIEKLHAPESTVVLSVGLAPGITNMLVKRGKQKLDAVRQADIYVLLGLGEAHGRAAIEWTLNNLAADFSVVEQGAARRAVSFSEGKKTMFPDPFGRRTAYRFNFSDQHIIPRTLNIPSVSTRLCFDSALVTHAAAGLKRAGITRLLAKPSIREKALDLWGSMRRGTERFAAKVDVCGQMNGRPALYQGSVTGIQEARATGQAAAYVARSLVTEQHPFGIFHMEELFQPEALFAGLQGAVSFEERIVDTSLYK